VCTRVVCVGRGKHCGGALQGRQAIAIERGATRASCRHPWAYTGGSEREPVAPDLGSVRSLISDVVLYQ
jgi:hypothetical protein